MHVTVIEKRAEFSRVNILLLWPQTADDLMACTRPPGSTP